MVRDVKNEKILSFEGGFIHNSPFINARLVFYDTRFNDLIENRNFFLDQDLVLTDGSSGQFINYIIRNIARRHRGIEASAEFKLSPEFRIGMVAAIGEYIYTERPTVDIIPERFWMVWVETSKYMNVLKKLVNQKQKVLQHEDKETHLHHDQLDTTTHKSS